MYRSKTFKLIASLLIICMSACKPAHKIIPVDPRFAAHISGYTAGMLSTHEHIKVELANTPEKNAQGKLDSTLLKDAFSFKPAIKGHAVWVNDRTIEFIPDQALDHATFYNGSFKLYKFKKVEDDLEKFRFQFSTYEQHLYVTVDGLRNLDSYNIEWQRLEGKIKTTDKEDTSKLKALITAKYGGKALTTKIEPYSYGENEYRFYIDSIRKTEVEKNLQIHWNGEKIGAKEFGSQDLKVAALGDYQILQAKVVDEDQQFIEVEFSESLLANQNLNGIVTLSETEKLSFAIENNTVKVFLADRITGLKTLHIGTGIKNCKGYKMKNAYKTELEFFPAKPAVRLKGKGSILPNSQGLIFPFETINLKSVEVRVIKIFENNVHQFLQVNDLNGSDGLTRVGKIVAEKKLKLDYHKRDLSQWNDHVIDLSKMINPDPGSIYRVSIKFEKEDAIYACDATSENENEMEEETVIVETDNNMENDGWDEDNWNDNQFDDYETWEDYGDNYTPCDNSYYHGKAVSRNILASDIGLVFKLDENKMSHSFVSNMITTEPMPNTRIEFFDYTKQLIAGGTSDQDGKLDLFLKEKPFLMVAKNGRQRAYMKLLDGNANALSKFDIDGEQIKKGIKGFLYAERGVWRPGDSMFIYFILEDKEHQLPDQHPVSFELSDPQGNIVYQTSSTNHTHHTYDFRTATTPQSPTGTYTGRVKVGNSEFSKSFHVETVKPNRLKINIDAPSIIEENNENNLIQLQARWLHGADAKNLKANVSVSLTQTETKFQKFPNYTFHSPVRTLSGQDIVVFDSALSERGQANIPCNLGIGQQAAGMLKAHFVTKVFEEGGDFSIDKQSVLYSPFDTYIGLQIPQSENFNHALDINKAYTFSVVSVNNKGDAVSAEKLHLKIYKIEWRWWYETHEDDASAWLSKNSTIVVMDSLIRTSKGQTTFAFKAPESHYARYLMVISDELGGHETGAVVCFDEPGWSGGSSSTAENAHMLNFSCDKTKYTKGEQVKMIIPSASNGKALISIEKGNKVLQTYWTNTTKGETRFEFTCTADMSPNVYLHVTLIQPHANTLNDLPIRLYGIVPIQVDDIKTHLQPVISMAEEIRPESKTNITVQEAGGKKMTYTLAMVDEGLLDLTRFKTPDAWETFYAKEALGVKTWDLYDNVIGAYGGRLDHLLSIGGDGYSDGTNTTKANSFKPMVTVVGPFTLEAGRKATHQINIPNYVGSVRVMVVAQQEGAYGKAEKTIAVKKPLMVLATLPRVLTPTETLSLPVDIFAMKENVKDVKIEVAVNDLLQLTGAKQQHIHFTKTGDELVHFPLRVAGKTGIGRVKIKATSGSETAYQEIELDVRMPNPVRVESKEFIVDPNQSANTEILFKNIEGTNSATIEIANIPPLNINKRLNELMLYPHGCIEQTTSAAFPQLYLSRLQEMSDSQQNVVTRNIKKAIQRIQLFQTTDGGFSYWPGEQEASEFGSNYAGHFLLEAEKQGYAVPATVKSRWIKYQTQTAKKWTHQNGYFARNETNEMLQAYRLYTLALSGNADLGSMNKLREENKLSPAATAELALAYQCLGQTEVAKKLLLYPDIRIPDYREQSEGYGSTLRDKAIMLLACSKIVGQSANEALINHIRVSLNSDQWLTTQETAYCLLAVTEYYGLSKPSPIKIACQLNNNSPLGMQTPKTQMQLHFSEKEIKNIAMWRITNKGTARLYVKVLTRGVPLMGDTTVTQNKISMQCVFKNRQNEVINPLSIKQGTDFYVMTTIRNTGKNGVWKELCLNQLFPDGWEILHSRLNDDNRTNTTRYQDIRDDRVYSYFDLKENEAITVTIQLNATYIGRFYMPGFYSEAMYDNSVHANTKGAWVEVVKQ